MASTSYIEFKKLFDRIPKERLPYVHFIPLRTGTKVPIGNWKGKAHLTLYECKDVLKTGGNIAVAGIPKGLMFLDIDTNGRGDLEISKKILDIIPNTFTVKTRSGGLHYYFLNNGDWDNQKFMLLSKNESIERDDLVYHEVGELRTNWQYVVSAGSWVEPETYRVVNDVPLLEFTGEITKLFRQGNVKDLTPKQLPPTEGKKGIPLSKRHKEMLERMKEKREGKIEPDIKTNSEKKEELLTILRKRGYNV